MKAFVSCGAHGRGAARTKHTLQLIPGFLVAAWLAVPGAMAAQKPLQVFILAGQSNMHGQAKVSTFEHIGMDPATQPMLAEMQMVAIHGRKESPGLGPSFAEIVCEPRTPHRCEGA